MKLRLVTLDATEVAVVEKLSDDVYALLVTLESDESPLPSELMLFQNGITPTTKGKFLFNEEHGRALMTKYKEHGKDKLPFDYGHGMVSFAGDQRAAGWFVPEVRAGALWATKIEWTPRATKELGEKEWRFYSPAFKAYWPEDMNEPAIVRELINCALTNLPATFNQKPIVASETFESESKTMKLILQKLGVSEEHEAVNRVGQLLSDEATNVALLSSLGFKTVTELASAFTGGQKELKEVKSKVRKQAIAALSTDGRLPPTQHEFAESLSDEQFAKFVAGLPASSAPTAVPVSTPVPGTQPGARAPVAASAVSLTEEELELCSQFGQDPDEMKKTKLELINGPHPYQYVPKQPKPAPVP